MLKTTPSDDARKYLQIGAYWHLNGSTSDIFENGLWSYLADKHSCGGSTHKGVTFLC